MRPAIAAQRSAAAPYLMPLIVIVATSMVSRTLSDGFDVLYPARVVAAGVALWCYRDKLTSFLRRPSLAAIFAGRLVFGLWIVLAPHQSASGSGLPGMLGFETLALADFPDNWKRDYRANRRGTRVSRVRAQKARRLRFRKCKLPAIHLGFFFGSSILFGVLHGEWIAGIAAGMIFAAVMYRRGQLADAIGAHMTTNALLSVYVLLSHNWSLWS